MKPESVIGWENIEAMLEIAAGTPPGCFVEVGVYKGGSAFHLAALARAQDRQFYGYDTFTGIPYAEEGEQHKVGDFSDTSYESVCEAIPHGHFIKGLFPQSMVKDMGPIAFAHLDVDQKQAYKEAIEALWPHMTPGGVMWFDEPSEWQFPAVAKIVREFFNDRIQVASTGKWYVRC